jgi:hypothetical protein
MAPPKRDIFECMTRLNGLFFSGDDWDILKEEFTNYLMTQKSPLNSNIVCFFLCTSIVYGNTRGYQRDGKKMERGDIINRGEKDTIELTNAWSDVSGWTIQ